MIASIERRAVAPGVEIVEANLQRGETSGGTMYVVYADPARARPRLVLNEAETPLATLAPNAIAVVNAGFFTPERRPTGLLVSGGRVLGPFVPSGGAAGSGVVVLRDGHVELWTRDKITAETWRGAALAIQAGPRIIEAGGAPGIRKDDGERAHRTIIGADREGRLAVGIIRGPATWASGPSLFEAQQLLGAEGLGKTGHPDLAFAFALNLDGGPSTGMHVRHPTHPIHAPESSPVYSALALENAGP